MRSAIRARIEYALTIMLATSVVLILSACVGGTTPIRASIGSIKVGPQPDLIGNQGNQERVSGRPSWIDRPEDGVSASAGTHVRGRAAQEDLAILRAREEFAKRFGVNIQSDQIVSTEVSNDIASTVASAVVQESSKQSNIKALVKAKWLDPGADVLWIWLIPAK